MTDVAWLALVLLAQFIVPDSRVFRGRVLTGSMQRVVRWRRTDHRGRWLFRVIQIGTVIAAFLVGLLPLHLEQGIVVALYLDDYLTGDDDRRRRFRDAVRNKVKWLMQLPAAEGVRA